MNNSIKKVVIVGGGTAGNADLKPIRSTNFDANIEWYFAPRSVVSAAFYNMDLSSYVSLGTYKATYIDTASGKPARGVAVSLFAIEASGARRLVKATQTNADGRCDAPFLSGAEMAVGAHAQAQAEQRAAVLRQRAGGDDDGGVGEDPTGGDVALAGQFVAYLPQRLHRTETTASPNPVHARRAPPRLGPHARLEAA